LGDDGAPPLGIRAWLAHWKHATPKYVLPYQSSSLYSQTIWA